MRVFQAVVLAVTLLSAASAQAACANPEQTKAAQLRQFHYQLQVAALNCRGDDPSLPGKWQSYVQRHAATLAHNASILRDYFKGANAFDRHNTVLTNRESVRVHEMENYCETMAPRFDRALELDGPKLASYASQVVTYPDNVTPCREPKSEKKTDKKKAG